MKNLGIGFSQTLDFSRGGIAVLRLTSFLLPLWEKVAHLSVSDRRRMRGNVEAKYMRLAFYPSPVRFAATLSLFLCFVGEG